MHKLNQLNGTKSVYYLNELKDKVAVIVLPENLVKNRDNSFNVTKLFPIFIKGGLKLSTINKLFFMFLDIPKKGKFKKVSAISYVQELKEVCDIYGIDVVMVMNADFYQYLTDDKKFQLNVGNVIQGAKFSYGSGKSKVEIDLTNLKILPTLNYKIIEMYPNRVNEYAKPFQLLATIVKGGELRRPEPPKIKSNVYKSAKEVKDILKKLYKEKRLFVDIETTGLNWYSDRLLTMSFCSDDKEAHCIAIHPQYHSEDEYQKIKKIMKSFFENYKGWLVGHNWIGFDQAFITHEIMRDFDFQFPQELIVNQFKIHDTLLMAYVLKNSTERLSLGLKNLAYKYMGDWDSDIDQKNLINTPLEKVALYNNYDVIATYYLFKEFTKELTIDNFKTTYDEFRDIGYDLLKMKMNGLRIDLEQTKNLYNKMAQLLIEDLEKLRQNPYVQQAEQLIAIEKMEKYNKTHKNQKSNYEEFLEPFNPSSNPQKQILFFQVMNLDTANKTKSGEKASDKNTIQDWLSDPNINEDKKEVLSLILEYQASEKVRNTYLKNMIERCVQVSLNDYRIFANFNQTGTISGRLSSQGVINMQTIPSGSKYGKMIKKLFIAPDGFLMAGSDFSALEDRLMANASQDPNKIAIFTSGIDGHCMNATAYFKDQMVDIIDKLEKVDTNTKFYQIELENEKIEYVYEEQLNDYQFKAKKEISKEEFKKQVINSVKKKYPELRQAGKSYTFGLNYLKSRESFEDPSIYDNYWSLYSKVDDYNKRIISQAKQQGYLVSRYSNLRIWLPDIKSSIRHIREKAERVAVNFSIQSGNFFTLKAIHCFQKWIEKNNLIKEVKIVNTIHDAIYLYIKNDLEIIERVNRELIECMVSDYNNRNYDKVLVPLEAELDIGHNMAEIITLPNNITQKEIEEKLKELNNI